MEEWIAVPPIHLLIVWEQMGWIREKTEFRLMQPPRAAAAQWDGILPMGTFELVGKMMCVWCEDYLLGIDGESYMYIGHESYTEVMILSSFCYASLSCAAFWTTALWESN
ncbi:hypothetical protein TNCV_1546391 [Trichonephila clavipes]|nr:hypothetical protein TNCV_1546391 [Trichonephila clavipes]